MAGAVFAAGWGEVRECGGSFGGRGDLGVVFAGGLGFFEVSQDRAGGGDAGFIIAEAEAGGGGDAVVLEDFF